MADVDLIFRQLPLHQPADLVFGESEALPDVEVTLAGTLPPLQAVLVVAPLTEVTLTGTLPGLQAAIEARYNSDTARPLVAQARTDFQPAVGVDAGPRSGWDKTAARGTGADSAWQPAVPVPAGPRTDWRHTVRTRSGVAPRHQEAVPLATAAGSAYQNMLRSLRPALSTTWVPALPRAAEARTDWQERFRDRRPAVRTTWGVARPLHRGAATASGPGLALVRGWRSRYQEAIVPPPGLSVPPVIPPEEPCYTPPAGDAVHLLFADGPGTSDLLFVCENHGPTPGETVVVPIKRVYMVINNVNLLKVDGASLVAIPTYALSMSLDVDSWTWGFSAQVPGELLAQLLPVDGAPVELEASINGAAFRVLAEKLTRTRTFGKNAIQITGRGKSAALAAPYAPIQTFRNTIDRTANQLMEDALTFNGVPIGWTVDWQIEDWLVPAGAWHKQGVYIDALAAIADAAGAYLQPHPTAQVMRVLPRYPFAPWDWATEITPDFELPSAVTTTEGIEWLDKPDYNRVFVSGVSAGVLGQVTRGGTAGDLLAPMVTDALITDTIAARQKGRTILSDTGRQALVNLRLPVLAETGVIVPGKFVRYVDGADVKLGVVRSTQVDKRGDADLWQSIAVETHEEA